MTLYILEHQKEFDALTEGRVEKYKMNNMNTLANLGVCVGLILGVAACDTDDDNSCCDPTNPECPNYDPCYGQSPVTAEFNIYDEIFVSGPFAGNWYQDSVLYAGNVNLQRYNQN